jgi:hypothetical protein
MMAARLGPKAPTRPVKTGDNCKERKPCDAKAAGIQTTHDIPKAKRKNNHKFRFSDLYCSMVAPLFHIYFL